jgi:FkbM family methyltransferase
MPSRFEALSNLQQALSESLPDVRERVEAISREVKSSSLVLYGAGTLGQHTLGGLRAAGVEPIAFADDTPGKQGTELSGLPVVAPAQITERFGSEIIVVVTMMTSRLSFLQAKDRLRTLGINRVMSFLHVAWTYPHQFLPYYQFELPETLLSKKEQILAGTELWYDDESLSQYMRHLLFRFTLNFEVLPPSDHAGYYPDNSISSLPASSTFVDCGAYDGDTVREFLRHHPDSFHEIHAFEPDPDNYEKLQAFTGGLDTAIASRIHTHKAGTGDKTGTAFFEAAGNMSSSLTTTGTSEVEIVRLDDIEIKTADAVFLKLDVEGFEQQTLAGARKLIEKQTPLIALSAYHRPHDLWELPQQLRAINPDYRFFLRTHGEDGMDVICYAVPPRLLTA